MTDLGVLPGGCDAVEPSAIGGRGVVVGVCLRSGDDRAVLWKQGRLVDLGAVADVGRPFDVDDNGRVLTAGGASTEPFGARRLTVRW